MLLHYCGLAGGFFQHFAKFIATKVIDFQSGKSPDGAIAAGRDWDERVPRVFVEGEFYEKLMNIVKIYPLEALKARLNDDLLANDTWLLIIWLGCKRSGCIYYLMTQAPLLPTPNTKQC